MYSFATTTARIEVIVVVALLCHVEKKLYAIQIYKIFKDFFQYSTYLRVGIWIHPYTNIYCVSKQSTVSKSDLASDFKNKVFYKPVHMPTYNVSSIWLFGCNIKTHCCVLLWHLTVYESLHIAEQRATLPSPEMMKNTQKGREICRHIET